MTDWAIWGIIFPIVYVTLSCAVTIHAVLWKRDTRAVIAWVGLAWMAPLLGAFAYLCFGINRIQRKAESLQKQDGRPGGAKALLSDDDRRRAEELACEYPNLIGLAAAGTRLTGLPLAPGNSVVPLIDGDEAYPSMISAINAARKSVGLLSYIFDSDRVGEAFLDALVDAQERNVQVRVLIDDVGAKYSRSNMVRRLSAAGLQAASFLPARFPLPHKYANLRNHRKILVVDGQTGFTGGTNIREGHCLKLQPADPVQCLHFRLEGPIVAQFQHVFVSDWNFATGEELTGDDWFPQLERSGSVWARGVEHGPDENFEYLTDLIAAALASARERVRIVTPYFLPSASLIQALNVAALRGVNVEIFIPEVNNIRLIQWAATAQLWQLLEKGCRVFTTPPPFDHTKLLLIDGIWTLLGSSNWDPRSLRLNFEFNVECYDAQLAGELDAIVDRKACTATEVTLADVDGRRFLIRLRDGLARLLTPYL